MSLRTRLALVGVLVLAATLLAVGAVAHQLVRVQGRTAVDAILRQELDDLRVGLPDLLDQAAAAGEVGPAEVVTAVERYLALHPGSDGHLLVVDTGDRRLTTRAGPVALLALLDEEGLPTGRRDALLTQDSDVGPLRVLSSTLRGAEGAVLGTARIYGPLGGVVDDATQTLGRIGIAGLIGLLLGGMALVLVTHRALQPLQDLARTARAVAVDGPVTRAPAPRRQDEVGQVTEEFNRMLDGMAADADRRQQLLAAVSHELRTPLAVAQGHLEVFEHTVGGSGVGAGGEAVALAGVVRAELERIARLVDDLSSIGRGVLATEVVIGPVFMPDLFAELRGRLDALGLGHVRIVDPPPLVLELDQGRVAQSLLNLVRNAVQHTPEGTFVEVSATAVGTTARIRVADRGPGIPDNLKDRAFDAFVTRRREGSQRRSGLGLTVVKALTEAQGGTVTLRTGEAGTTVDLRFPRPTDG